MADLSLASQLSLYALLLLLGGSSLALFVWQIAVLRGHAMKNPDGSVDDWRRHEHHFGMAVADVFIAGPLSVIAIALVFIAPRWGHWLLTMFAFFFVWVNTVTTVTSVKFRAPKLTLAWFIVFPFGALAGLAYLIWLALHFDQVFGAPM